MGIWKIINIGIFLLYETLRKYIFSSLLFFSPCGLEK